MWLQKLAYCSNLYYIKHDWQEEKGTTEDEMVGWHH